MTWTIKLYSGEWEQQLGTVLAGQFDGDIRDKDQGSWELGAPISGVKIRDRRHQAVQSVAVFDGGTLMFGGTVGRVETSGSASGVTRMSWTGLDAYALALRRFAYPDPEHEAPWIPARYVVRDVRASAAAAEFVRVNLGSGAKHGRQDAAVEVVDEGAGRIGTWGADPTERLDDVLERICTPDVAVTAQVNEAGGVTFTFAPRRVINEVLSPHDLVSWKRTYEPRSVTHVTVRGDNRGVAVASTGARGRQRIEASETLSGELQPGELQTKADDLLAAGDEKWFVTAQMTARATRRLRYLRDYRVGDIITAQIPEPFAIPIAGVELRWTQDAQTVTPILGEGTDDEHNRRAKRLRAVERTQRARNVIQPRQGSLED